MIHVVIHIIFAVTIGILTCALRRSHQTISTLQRENYLAQQHSIERFDSWAAKRAGSSSSVTPLCPSVQTQLGAIIREHGFEV